MDFVDSSTAPLLTTSVPASVCVEPVSFNDCGGGGQDGQKGKRVGNEGRSHDIVLLEVVVGLKAEDVDGEENDD